MPIDPDVALAATYPDLPGSWNADDVILYHLGLGAGSPSFDPGELGYVYETMLKVLPTFGVVPGLQAVGVASPGPGLDYEVAQVLHGEQELTVHSPLPSAAAAVTTRRVEAVYDKGKAALVVLRADTRTLDGKALCTNRFSLFVRGEGGFGGDRSPARESWQVSGEPAAEVVQRTLPQQAALYRLSGDRNPLHIDPSFAAGAGFDAPILHGLCSYGMVCKAVVDQMLDGDPTAVASWTVRFAGTVIPGETLVTKMWCHDDQIRVATFAQERGAPVLSGGVLTVR